MRFHHRALLAGVALAALHSLALTPTSSAQQTASTARKFTKAEQAARCADPDTMFPQGAYRPLPTFATSQKGPGARELVLDIEARLHNGVRMGNYTVDGVPSWRIAPTQGSPNTAHIYDPVSGYKCIYARDQLTSDAKLTSLFTYSGFRLSLQHGDRLKTNVRSAIDFTAAPGSRPNKAPNGGVPCQATNQHTHGLLVHAINPDKTRGDYVFDVAMPDGVAKSDQCDASAAAAPPSAGNTLTHDIRIPAKAPDKDQALASGRHPAGLFWYHPHGHGYSAYHLRGGQSGLITIGGVAGDTGVRPSAAPSPATNIRHMIIRDAQIAPQANGPNFMFNPVYETGLCGDFRNTAAKEFQLGNGECSAAGKPGRWVFTINGVQHPRIAGDVQAHERELWRIANGSANFTYLLRLYPKKNGQIVSDPCQTKAFDIVELDGVAAQPAQHPAFSCPDGRPVFQLFMMPGSRASIALDPSPGESFEVFSEAVDTGQDRWPPVALAEVAWPAAMRASAAAAPAAPVDSRAAPRTRPLAPKVTNALAVEAVASGPANICELPAGWERIILFVKRKVVDRAEVFGLVAGMRPAGVSDLAQGVYFRMKSAASAGHAHQHGGGLAPFDPGQFEKIAFSEIEALFAKPVAAGDTELGPAFGNTPNLSQICARFGSSETWVIENWTDEIHNFHLHQTKFAVSDNTSPAYFNMPSHPMVNPQATATQTALGQFYLNTLNSHHDSVPLGASQGSCADGAPRKAADTAGCQPARVAIIVKFNRQEQVGRYPYHCHILEHEDLGMMGEIRVLGAQEPDHPAGP